MKKILEIIELIILTICYIIGVALIAIFKLVMFIYELARNIYISKKEEDK